jgi:epoxyqueuosine reductase
MAAVTDQCKEDIRARALAEGFDVVHVTVPGAIPEMGPRLDAFLNAGFHGTMEWLSARAEQRAAPDALWPEVKSVLMLGLNYGPVTDPMHLLDHKAHGVISVYAQNKDYHDLIKRRLKRVGRWMGETYECGIKVFVDTAPVAEKTLAEAAGIGWQGKHTNLVSREFGSWLFLGAIFSTLSLETDAPEVDHCGSCTRCLDICPTNAFPAPYQLDARRCISYLTIEHKGPIAPDLRVGIGNRIYGCDDCLAVCPWNKYAQLAKETGFLPRAELAAPRLADLARLDDAGFRQVFAGSPIKRIGRDRFVRNVLIAIGNSGELNLAPVAEELLADPSPLVRGMAVWALSQLLSPEAFGVQKAQHEAAEGDPQVREEWAGFIA